MIRSKKARKYSRFEYEAAPDISRRAKTLIKNLQLDYLDAGRVFFYRSQGSKSRAYARTWGLPSIWQNALKVGPAYIIEVISKYFDKLPKTQQDKVLLHELSHIPKNFSGALLPHTRKRKGSFKSKLESLIDKYMENQNP